MAIAIALMVLIVAGAVVGLTQLDLGQEASDRKKHRPPASVTTVATIASTTTTTQARRGTVHYTVKSGDTLIAIARRFGVTTDAIVQANKLTDPNHLTLGQRLTIPPAVVRKLVVSPAKVGLNSTVTLTLKGAPPGERITFTIVTPAGSFTGPPHLVALDGTVTTSYTPGGDDPPGTYLIAAHGDQGTDVQAALTVATPPG